MFPDHHQPPPHFAVNSHLTTTTSEEADSKKDPITITNDGEVVRRRSRGRPPGSKNKPKPPPPVSLTVPEPYPSMSTYVLEVPGGSDIVAAVTRFCHQRNTGLCVLYGSGVVSNVSFRQPTTTTAVTFHGVFNLSSISATILPPSTSSDVLIPDFLAANKFVVTLAAGSGGKIVGGIVLGPLIAAGAVHIVAASFSNPLYYRLPIEEDNHLRNDDGMFVPTAGNQSPGLGSQDSRQHQSSTTLETLSMYSLGHRPHDAIWAPTPRQFVPHSSHY